MTSRSIYFMQKLKYDYVYTKSAHITYAEQCQKTNILMKQLSSKINIKTEPTGGQKQNTYFPVTQC